LIAKSLKGGDCRYWYGCGLLKRYIRRLECQSVFRGTDVLGKPAQGCAKDFVAWVKLLYVFADRFSPPSDISAYEPCVLA
jgi:hypothetical protein